jgi:hypothetical protein
MKPQLSEFSYGYAVTEAFVRLFRAGLTAAPLFPSLFQEGQPGGGYDVMIQRWGVPVFLQFKLSDCMVRGTAREAQEGQLTPPFYRMHLRPRSLSDQHDLLLDLEQAGEEVYYVAPLFHTTDEFNQTYLSDTILRQSIFLRPGAIGALADDGPHHVAFEARNRWFVYSDPRPGDERVDEEAVEQRVRRSVRERGARRLTAEGWREVVEKIVHVVDQERDRPERDRARRRAHLEVFRQVVSNRHPAEQVAYLSRAFLESQCVVVWES